MKTLSRQCRRGAVWALSLPPMDFDISCCDMVLTGPSAHPSARGFASLWIKAGFAPRWTSNVVGMRRTRLSVCRHYAKRRGCSSYHHAVAATRGVESASNPPSPSPRLNRPRRPNAIDATRRRAGASAQYLQRRGRFDGAGASRRGRRRRRLRAVSSGDGFEAARSPRDLPSARRLPLRPAPEASEMRRRGAAADGARPVVPPRRSLCYFPP